MKKAAAGYNNDIFKKYTLNAFKRKPVFYALFRVRGGFRAQLNHGFKPKQIPSSIHIHLSFILRLLVQQTRLRLLLKGER